MFWKKSVRNALQVVKELLTTVRHSVESPSCSTSTSLSLNWNWRGSFTQSLLEEQLNNTSSSEEMDDTDKDPEVCFSPIVPISNTSSDDDDDATKKSTDRQFK